MAILYEDLLHKVGGFGTYQKRIILLIAFPQIMNAFTTFIPNFILGEHKHRCSVPGIENDTYINNYSSGYNVTKCTYSYNSTKYSCSNWVYDRSVYTATLISQFDMVCDKKFYRSHLVMAHHLGTLTGSLVGSLCGDVFGRKPVYVIGGLLMFISNIILPWIDNIFIIAMMRFINGGGGVMTYLAGFVLATEMIVPSKRILVAFCISTFYNIGLYIMTFVAYFVRDWFYLVLITSIPIGVFVFYWFIIPESPRWLIANGKSMKGIQILKKLSKVNKKKFPLDGDSEEISVKQDIPLSVRQSMTKVFTTKTLLFRFVILVFNWISIDLTYYGITMNVGKLGGDIYINFIIATTVGISGEIISLFTIDRIGRKKLQLLVMIIGGVGCFSTLFIALYGNRSLHWMTIALAMIGKMSSGAGYLIVYLYTVELFPTVVRAFVISLCSSLARIGSISSSYIGDLGLLLDTNFGRALPLIIFGSVGISAGLLCIFLPETMNKGLPETVKDAADLIRNRKMKDKETEDMLLNSVSNNTSTSKNDVPA